MNDGVFSFPSGQDTKPTVIIIDHSKTVQFPQNWTHMSILVIGGGGGGGGGRRDSTATAANGGSGGSGAGLAYVRRMHRSMFIINNLEAGSALVTIGAGGAGGAAQTTDATNGNNGVAGGLSKILFTCRAYDANASGMNANNSEINALGGGKGTGGTTSFANADATSSGYGHIMGFTGGQASTSGNSQFGTHTGNNWASNASHTFVAVGSGASGSGKVIQGGAYFNAPTIFYTSSWSTTGPAGRSGPDAAPKFKQFWEAAPYTYPQAPVIEELGWWTGSAGGGGGCGNAAGAGGNGGAGFAGSGGGGGGGGTTQGGAGGAGGNGRVVIWLEKLY